MSLRWRLALTTFGVALPILVVVAFGYRFIAKRLADDIVVTLVQSRFSLGIQEECDASLAPYRHTLDVSVRRGPFSTQGATRKVNVYFMDLEGHSAVQDAPKIEPDRLSELRESSDIVAFDVEEDGQSLRFVLLQMSGDGACAIALAVAPEIRSTIPPVPIVLVPVILALIAVLVGIAPIVRRARALTHGVREWQQGNTKVPPIDTAGDELGELSRAFQDAANTVEARETDLREFVENVSHDLATPLTVLQGHLASLADKADSEIVRQAMNEAHYLGALLGSLGVTAKFETGSTIDEVIDLRDIALRVVTRHQGLAARLSLSLECAVPDEPVFTSGDITFTEQALTNLVGNALRHNTLGGKVAVVLDVVDTEFSLRVLDDGPGLTQSERERVMLRGERGDGARSRSPEGRGLGLPIVARVAAIHGWGFSLDSNTPRGLVAQLRGSTQKQLLNSTQRRVRE